jgi:MinD superfamily P-loop ATPase
MRPYAILLQAPITCEKCEHFCVVDVWDERGDWYPKLEECPSCGAAYDLDVLLSNVQVIR